MTTTVTAKQVGLLRRFITERAAGTATGAHWLARVRPVALELVTLYSGKRQVRQRVDHALALAVPLVARNDPVTDHTIRAFEQALDAIDTAASPALRSLTHEARQALTQATNKTLTQVLDATKPA